MVGDDLVPSRLSLVNACKNAVNSEIIAQLWECVMTFFGGRCFYSKLMKFAFCHVLQKTDKILHPASKLLGVDVLTRLPFITNTLC